jgi:hypothetical protein
MSSTGAVKTASTFGKGGALSGMGFAAGLLLLGFAGLGATGSRDARNFLLACGFVLSVASVVVGCGGGSGGGGGGPVSTTTTIVSSGQHVGFGTPVTFTVTVKPSGNATPSGLVQLIDNGQPLGAPTAARAGVAFFQANSLPIGIHNIVAQYQGDANTLASNSATLPQGITGQVGLQITVSSNGISQTADFTLVLN